MRRTHLSFEIAYIAALQYVANGPFRLSRRVAGLVVIGVQSRHGRMLSETTFLTHSDLLPPSIGALRKIYSIASTARFVDGHAKTVSAN